MSFKQFCEEVLIAVFQEGRNKEGWVSYSHIRDKYGLSADQTWPERAFKYLREQNLIESRSLDGGSEATLLATLTGAGLIYIEDKYGSKDGVGDLLDPVDQKIGDQIKEPTLDIPAADRVVSLGHNQIAAMEAPLEQVIHAVELSNGDPEEPSFRQRIIGQLRAGRELLRSGEYKASLLQTILVSALNELVVRYKDGVIAGLATNLLQYLLLNGLHS